MASNEFSARIWFEFKINTMVFEIEGPIKKVYKTFSLSEQYFSSK